MRFALSLLLMLALMTAVAFAQGGDKAAPAKAKAKAKAEPAPAKAAPAPVKAKAGGTATKVMAPPPDKKEPATKDEEMRVPEKEPPAAAAVSQDQCIDELRKDKNWKESLKNQLRALVGVPEREEPKGGYSSPNRAQCTAQMAKNVDFRNKVRAKELLPDVRAELRESVRFDDHSRDAKRMLRNKRHVVMAYVVLWALTILFVVMMFLRQRRLNEEIERLRRQMEKAVKED
jgi:hypothetical protein